VGGAVTVGGVILANARKRPAAPANTASIAATPAKQC